MLGCADILVSTASGNLQVECQPRLKGLVSNTEAFEVLGKTTVGPKPVAYVTVGKPGFVDMAVKNSYSNRVTLINHKTLAEAAVLILEKKKNLDDLLQSGHYVDKGDLR